MIHRKSKDKLSSFAKNTLRSQYNLLFDIANRNYNNIGKSIKNSHDLVTSEAKLHMLFSM